MSKDKKKAPKEVYWCRHCHKKSERWHEPICSEAPGNMDPVRLAIRQELGRYFG